MLVEEISSKTALVDKIIQKAISHLLIVKDGAFATERITLKKVSKSGASNLNVFSDIQIVHLLEMTSMGEGSFVNQDTESYGLIEVGASGALALEDDEYLQLGLSNLASTKAYIVYGIEAPVLTPYAAAVDKINITPGTSSLKRNVGQAQTLIVPKELISLELTYVNGQTSKYLAPELKAISGAANDIVSVEQGAVVYGSKNLFGMDLSNAVSYEVYTDGNGLNFYTITPKNQG